MKPHFVLALSFALIAPAFAQRNFDNVEIKVVPVAKNIYMLEGSGGNIGVSVGADGNLIVDDQFAPLAEKIDAAVQKLNPGKLKFVLTRITMAITLVATPRSEQRTQPLLPRAMFANVCPPKPIPSRKPCP